MCFVQGVADVTVNSVATVDPGRTGWNTARRAAEGGADVTTTIASRPLAAIDRCDRCGAQAYVRATMISGSELLFCAHHWHENESVLRDVATAIHDETDRLADVPSTALAEER
jgi:hypothetical protein